MYGISNRMKKVRGKAGLSQPTHPHTQPFEKPNMFAKTNTPSPPLTVFGFSNAYRRMGNTI